VQLTWQHLWQGFCHTPAGLLHSQPMQQPLSPLKHSCCPHVRPIPCSQQLGHSSAIFQQHYLDRAVPPRGPLPAAHSSITQRHLGLHVALPSSTLHHGSVDKQPRAWAMPSPLTQAISEIHAHHSSSWANIILAMSSCMGQHPS
jgi:hypothetical protein